MLNTRVEISQDRLDGFDGHVGDDGTFLNRGNAILASMWRALEVFTEIDRRHGRPGDE